MELLQYELIQNKVIYRGRKFSKHSFKTAYFSEELLCKTDIFHTIP